MEDMYSSRLLTGVNVNDVHPGVVGKEVFRAVAEMQIKISTMAPLMDPSASNAARAMAMLLKKQKPQY